MKVTIEIDRTPEGARKGMSQPDVSKMHQIERAKMMKRARAGRAANAFCTMKGHAKTER